MKPSSSNLYISATRLKRHGAVPAQVHLRTDMHLVLKGLWHPADAWHGDQGTATSAASNSVCCKSPVLAQAGRDACRGRPSCLPQQTTSNHVPVRARPPGAEARRPLSHVSIPTPVGRDRARSASRHSLTCFNPHARQDATLRCSVGVDGLGASIRAPVRARLF